LRPPFITKADGSACFLSLLTHPNTRGREEAKDIACLFVKLRERGFSI
jgi:hypothetical protein